MTYTGDLTPNGQNNNATPVDNGREGPVYVNAAKSAPVFPCIQSGESLERERLLRFVVGPENALYPDFSGKLPGDGFYCNLYRPVLLAMLAEKPFGADVAVPGGIVSAIENGLRVQALAMLSLARKAGQVSTGAAKAESMLKTGQASIYLTASPKDADTRYKLSFLAQEARARVVDFFTSDELSAATGASKVFHAVIGTGGTANAFFAHVRRMNLFREPTIHTPATHTTDQKQED